MSDFGEILKKLRENAGLSQNELAHMLWISKNTVSYYERSARSPSPGMLVNIADVFHVTTDYLLGREQKRRTLDVTDLPEEDIQFLYIMIQFLRNKNQPQNKTREKKEIKL